jgi:anti-sigma factor RsiW
VNRDQIEFAISQLADGTLDAAAQQELERLLATDAEARQLLAEYRTLDSALRTGAGPLPTIAWDHFRSQIAATVDAADQGVGRDERSALDGDTDEPIRLPRSAQPAAQFAAQRGLRWSVLAGMGLAIAASLLIGVGLGMRMIRQGTTIGPAIAQLPQPPAQQPTGPQASTPVLAMVQVSGPAAETAAGSAVANISVGPPPSLADGGSPRTFAEGIIYRPPGVIIGSGNDSAQDDTGPSLYQQ